MSREQEKSAELIFPDVVSWESVLAVQINELSVGLNGLAMEFSQKNKRNEDLERDLVEIIGANTDLHSDLQPLFDAADLNNLALAQCY